MISVHCICSLGSLPVLPFFFVLPGWNLGGSVGRSEREVDFFGDGKARGENPLAKYIGDSLTYAFFLRLCSGDAWPGLGSEAVY